MNTRELRVLTYYKSNGKWDFNYTRESSLLLDTLEMLSMLPDTKVIRKEAGTVAGVADLLICYKGKFVAVELKDNDGTTSPQQVKFLQEVRDAGGVGTVCRTLSEVYDALKSADNEPII
jgi:hypothetical protein